MMRPKGKGTAKMIKYENLILGSIDTNCYIVYAEGRKGAVIIDPAADAGLILDFIKAHGLKAEAVLLTHGHFDHIGAVDELEAAGITPFIYENELTMPGDVYQNCGSRFRFNITASVHESFGDGDVLNFDGFSLKVIHTPGHTAGSVCFYSEEDRLLFSGDTLFRHAYGRTDVPTASYSMIMDSIKNKLMLLPDDTKVLPGHGEFTTIGEEKKQFKV